MYIFLIILLLGEEIDKLRSNNMVFYIYQIPTV